VAPTRVTYAAVGNLGGRYVNTNFSQRVFLAPADAEVTVLVPRGTSVVGEPPPHVRVLPARLPTLAGFYLDTAARLLGRVGARTDVVVSDRSAVSIVGWALRRLRGYRWAVDLWDVPHKELVVDYAARPGLRGRFRRGASRAKVAALGFLLRRADLVLVSVRSEALERYEVDPRRLRSFSNAIDLEALAEGGQASRGPRDVCYVTSRMVGDRGLDVLLSALQRLSSSGSPPRVTLVGSLAEGMREEIAASPASGCIELRGELGLEEAHEVMRGSEVGLAPFRSNRDLDHTYPIKLYEYMALGCVVLASDLPGIRAVLGDPPAGVLVEPGDPAALAAALQELLDDDERRERLRAAGRERVGAFDAREKIRRLYEALGELAGGSAPAG
jgi:glycosyltransferase involved in cell wall biosynthesis